MMSIFFLNHVRLIIARQHESSAFCISILKCSVYSHIQQYLSVNVPSCPGHRSSLRSNYSRANLTGFRFPMQIILLMITWVTFLLPCHWTNGHSNNSEAFSGKPVTVKYLYCIQEQVRNSLVLTHMVLLKNILH